MQFLMQVLNKEPKIEGTLIAAKVVPAVPEERKSDFSDPIVQIEFTIEEGAPTNIDESPSHDTFATKTEDVASLIVPKSPQSAIPVDFVGRLVRADGIIKSAEVATDTDKVPVPPKIEGTLVVPEDKATIVPPIDSAPKAVGNHGVENFEPQILPKTEGTKIDEKHSDVPRDRIKVRTDIRQSQNDPIALPLEKTTAAIPMAPERSTSTIAPEIGATVGQKNDAASSILLPADPRVSNVPVEQPNASKVFTNGSLMQKFPMPSETLIETVQGPERAPSVIPAERLPQEAKLQPISSATEIVPKTPLPFVSERPAQVEYNRPIPRDLRPELTRNTMAANPSPDPNQTIQVTAMVATDQMTKKVAFGHDTRPLKEEALPSLAANESTELRRPFLTDAPRIEPSARSVVTQLVQAARATVEGMVEIRLSPEELGRVRLSMTTLENGMNVLVTTERPETLDLIRRNIELLAADLEGQGFQNLNFSFGDENQGREANQSIVKQGKDGESDLRPVFDGHVNMRQLTTEGRVDIRV